MSESFILYTSDYQLIEGLTDEQIGQLSRALFIYARDGEVIKLDPVVRMAFVFIKDKIDRNQGKYQARCEKNRQIALEREARKREARKTTNEHERAQSCTNVNERSRKTTNEHVQHLSDSDSDSDVTNVTDNNIIEPSKEASKSTFAEQKIDPASKPPKEKSSKIDYAAIKEYWNTQHDKTGSAMPRLTLMTENRKVMVKARLRQCGGDKKKLVQAIDQAMGSDFMNGNNSRNWVGKFDWIFGNEQNFTKVLEGNYDNEQPAAQQSAQDPAATTRPSIGERYQQVQHQQPASQQSQDDKFRWVIQQNLNDLKKNPRNKPARDSLARFYEQGVLQRLGIKWKPEK